MNFIHHPEHLDCTWQAAAATSGTSRGPAHVAVGEHAADAAAAARPRPAVLAESSACTRAVARREDAAIKHIATCGQAPTAAKSAPSAADTASQMVFCASRIIFSNFCRMSLPFPSVRSSEAGALSRYTYVQGDMSARPHFFRPLAYLRGGGLDE